MCGRFTLARDAQALSADFPDLPVDARLTPRYNIAPAQPVSAWLADPAPRMEIFSWGLVPPWAKDPAFGSKCINARAETLCEKPSFQAAFRRKRCLIPADGWYEWRRRAGGPPQPFRFRRRDQRAFAFAGLWEEWHDRDGGLILSCAVITCAANGLVRSVHPRMPALLREEDHLSWLDPLCPPMELIRMLEPVAADELACDRVSSKVNRAGIESPDLLRPVSADPDDAQPELF